MLGREPIAPEGGVLVEIQTQDPVQEPDAGRRNARQVGGKAISRCFDMSFIHLL